MHLIEAIVKNPVKIAVGVLIVALFGVVSLFRMPMQLTPEVQVPVISIQTLWPGASPFEVEQEIVHEQEEQLKGVEGVRKMSSQCMDSMGMITLEFKIGTNMKEALLRVSNRLQQVPEYPEDADQPVISTSSSSDRPIAWLILSARIPERAQIEQFQTKYPQLRQELAEVLATTNPGLAELRLRRLATKHSEIQAELLPQSVDVTTLRKFAENVIEARMERVEGVSNSNVLGGREEELQVVVDPEKLAARRLTIADLRQALRDRNQDTSAGDVWEGKRRYVIRTLGQFESPEEVADLLISFKGPAGSTDASSGPVYVRDVAEVRLGYKKPDGFVRRFGSNAIAVNVVRETTANVFDVMRGVQAATNELNQGVLRDQRLLLTQVYDETEYIQSAIELVNGNIILGGALTIIVLMLFLHPGIKTYIAIPIIAVSAILALTVNGWLFAITLLVIFVTGLWFARGSLVVGLAIPISIVGTFLMMQQMGRSLNVISLAGLAFAVGMLVDNAIVVLENIYRHHQLGARPMVAAMEGTKEVWGAVAASTLTTLAVFIPVLFVAEEAGQLFRDIALAISAAVGLSLIVSITVVPTAAARLMRRDDELGNAYSTHQSWFTRLTVRLNEWILGSTLRRLGTVALLTAASVLGTYAMWPKVEYLPTGNRNLIICILLPPPGYNLEQLSQMGQLVEDKLQPYWDVNTNDPNTTQRQYPAIEDFFYVARGRSVFLGLRSAEPDRVDDLLKLIDTLRPELPGTILVANKSSLFDQGLTAGRTIDIEITGPELEKLVAIGGRILGQAMSAAAYTEDGITTPAQARPIPGLDLSSPEVHVIPRQVVTQDLGMSARELGYAVNALVDGAYVTDYMHRGYQIDLSILGDDRYVEKTQDLAELPVATPAGRLVPIGSLALIKHHSGPEEVDHRERQRAVTIQVTPPQQMPLEDAIERIDQQVLEPIRKEGILGTDYYITLSGTADKLRETWRAMRWNLLLAMIITYLLMAALFESWQHPLVIMFSVPLGIVGGIGALHLLNFYLKAQGQPPQTLDVLTMLGFIILIGTVVNNAILVVHQSLNHIRFDRMPPKEAILESLRTRIRPMFMTTGTTILGLAPLVLFPGPGSELYRGLGAIVLGGLLVSTVFILVVIPALFSLTLDLERLFGFDSARIFIDEVPEQRPNLHAGGDGNGNGANHDVPDEKLTTRV